MDKEKLLFWKYGYQQRYQPKPTTPTVRYFNTLNYVLGSVYPGYNQLS